MRNFLIVFVVIAVWGAGVVTPWFIASPEEPVIRAAFAFGVALWAVMSCGSASVMAIVLMKVEPRTAKGVHVVNNCDPDKVARLAEDFFRKGQS